MNWMARFGAQAVLLAVLMPTAVHTAAAGGPRPTMLKSSGIDLSTPADRWYVAVPSGDEELFLSTFHRLERAGARKMQGFMPDVIVCDVPVDVDPQAVVGRAGVEMARAENVSRLSSYSLSIQPTTLEDTYRRHMHERRRPVDLASRPYSPADYDLDGPDVQMVPESAILESARRAAASGDPEDRAIYQNCEILAGTILIQLVLPDSDYPEEWKHYENWSDASIEQVNLGWYITVLEYQSQFENANLNVLYRWYKRVPIKAEPIDYEPSQSLFWLSLVMTQLGYPGIDTDVFNNVHKFNEDLRKRTGVDWVFTSFIVNAEKNAEHRFKNARSLAWHYIGGPYWVTSYPASHLEYADDMVQVFMHAIGHMFWGLDEDIGPMSSCEDSTGYLNVRNDNKVIRYSELGGRGGCGFGHSPVECWMNEGDMYAWYYRGDPCVFSKMMWGVSDRNENDVPDALDRAPSITFESADVETILTSPGAFGVHVQAVAVPNRNPMEPDGGRRDYAAPIRDIAVGVGGLRPYTLEPDEIGSNGYDAAFQVNLPPLLPGWLHVTVDARNVYNAQAETRVKSYLYVSLKYATFEIRHPNNGIDVSWQMVGATFDADFTFHRENIATGEQTVIAEGFSSAGPTSKSGLTPFDVVDTTAVVGERYRYWVSGAIDLPYRGGFLHTVAYSDKITAQRSVPRLHAPSDLISDAAPNPFSERTWISVSVPEVDVPAPGISQSPSQTKVPSTLVTISIFDVLGRPVGQLYRRYVTDRAVTVAWDGTRADGTPLPSGIYFARVDVGNVREVRKILLLR